MRAQPSQFPCMTKKNCRSEQSRLEHMYTIEIKLSRYPLNSLLTFQQISHTFASVYDTSPYNQEVLLIDEAHSAK